MGRFIFTPRAEDDVRYYNFAGQGSVAKLLTGVVFPNGRPSSVVTPAGFDRLWTVELPGSVRAA